MFKLIFGAVIIASLVGCAAAPPKNTSNLCEIFTEKKGWYKDSRKASKRWNGDIAVMMAMIYQESSFKARARPPRKKILGIIPGPRPASAYGYAQAINATWDIYKKSTGNKGADRNKFKDAVDFVGWYNHQSHRKNRIKKNDAYNLYLAYHEGHGGFVKKTFRKKKWLKDVSKKVSKRSARYRLQLNSCESRLNRGFLRSLLF